MPRMVRPAPPGHKWCPQCKQAKLLAEFAPDKQSTLGVHPWCRACKRHYDAESKRTKRQNYWRSRYGISEQEYQCLFAAQGGVCAICGNAETRTHKGVVQVLSVDHDHVTGDVRGLLCYACNTGIGFLRDDTHLLERAIGYLRGRGKNNR
jgi:hypothetical protein